MGIARRLALLLAGVAIVMAFGWTAFGQTGSRVEQTPAVGADWTSPERIVRAFYEAGSGDAGTSQDWARFRALFAPGARIVATMRGPDKAAALRAQTVEEYIAVTTPHIKRRGFQERGIGYREARYGGLAQVWSAYEARHGAGAEAEVIRGINSVQLAFADGRWWIVNVAWTNERSAGAIPAEYVDSQEKAGRL